MNVRFRPNDSMPTGVTVFLIISLCMALQSCSKYWVEKEEIGDFVIKEHWGKKWYGDTWVRNTEACSKTKDFCISDTFIHEYESNGRAVSFDLPFKEHSHLFDKYTAEPIECLNCESDEEYQTILGRLSFLTIKNLAISHTDTVSGDEITVERNSKKHKIWLVEILPEGSFIHEISPSGEPYHGGAIREFTVRGDPLRMAWLLCDPLCRVWQYDVETETYLKMELACDYTQYNSYWHLRWRSERAVPVHHWGGKDSRICYGPDGEPAFRIEDRCEDPIQRTQPPCV